MLKTRPLKNNYKLVKPRKIDFEAKPRKIDFEGKMSEIGKNLWKF